MKLRDYVKVLRAGVKGKSIRRATVSTTRLPDDFGGVPVRVTMKKGTKRLTCLNCEGTEFVWSRLNENLASPNGHVE